MIWSGGAIKIEGHKKVPASNRDVKYILGNKLFCGYVVVRWWVPVKH